MWIKVYSRGFLERVGRVEVAVVDVFPLLGRWSQNGIVRLSELERKLYLDMVKAFPESPKWFPSEGEALLSCHQNLRQFKDGGHRK